MHGIRETRGIRGNHSLKLQTVLANLELTHKSAERVVPVPYSCTYAKSDIKAARSILENLLSSVPARNEISSISVIPQEIDLEELL